MCYNGINMSKYRSMFKEEEINIPSLQDYPGPVFACQKCGKLTDENSTCHHCKTQYTFVINKFSKNYPKHYVPS
jgi:hypothetical protein